MTSRKKTTLVSVTLSLIILGVIGYFTVNAFLAVFADTEIKTNIGLNGESLSDKLLVASIDGARFYYFKVDGKITISGYYGHKKQVKIPASIDGAPVTVIAPGAFAISCPIFSPIIDDIEIGRFSTGAQSIETLTIPKSVVSMSSSSFDESIPWYKNLKKQSGSFLVVNGTLFEYNGSGGAVIIPKGVTRIGDGAFVDKVTVNSVVIPEGVTSIGDAAFSGCSLENITIPDSVTTIGTEAFERCSNLTDVFLPKPGSSTLIDCFSFSETPWFEQLENTAANGFVIANHILFEYNGPAKVVIPDGIMCIATNAFTYSGAIHGEKVQDITIPSSVITIGPHAFTETDSLETVTIVCDHTMIGNEAFRGCDQLSSVTISGNEVTIGAGAFKDCTMLETINFLSRATSIGREALAGSALTSVAFPDGITSINQRMCAGCTNLHFVSIPKGVTKIDNSAFMNCTDIAYITIPDGVTYIGTNAFYKCTLLPSDFTLPDSVNTIGEQAFRDSGLMAIKIPGSVTLIGRGAFRDCDSLESATLSEGTTSIGADAFRDARCWKQSKLLQVLLLLAQMPLKARYGQRPQRIVSSCLG